MAGGALIAAKVAAKVLKTAGAGFKMLANVGQHNRNIKTLAESARIAAERGELERELAYKDAALIRKHGKAITGAQRAVAGASGIVVDPGTSAMEVLLDTKREIEIDVYNKKLEGEVSFYQGQLESWAKHNEVKAEKAARTAAWIGGGIETAMSASSMMSNMKGGGKVTGKTKLTSGRNVSGKLSGYKLSGIKGASSMGSFSLSGG